MASKKVDPAAPVRGEDFYANDTVYKVENVFGRYYRSPAYRISYDDGGRLRGCLIRKVDDVWQRTTEGEMSEHA
jgi:hypothetical protein